MKKVSFVIVLVWLLVCSFVFQVSAFAPEMSEQENVKCDDEREDGVLYDLVDDYYVDDPDTVTSFSNPTIELSQFDPGIEIVSNASMQTLDGETASTLDDSSNRPASTLVPKETTDTNRSGAFSQPSFHVDNPGEIGSFATPIVELSLVEPGVEIISKRTPTARHFLKDERTYAYLFSDPTSFMDEEGKWKDTDLEVASSSFAYLDSTWYGMTREVDNDALQPVLWGFQTSVDGVYNIYVGQDLDGWPFYDYFRSHFQWDTSSIPDTSNILSVEINFYVPSSFAAIPDANFDTHECDIDFYAMTYKPSNWGRGNPIGKVGDTLWQDAYDGNFYGFQYVYQNGQWYNKII